MQRVEDFLRVGLDVGDAEGLPDDPVRIDDVRPALCVLGRGFLGRADGLVVAARRSIGVRQQRAEIVVLLRERQVGVGRIERGADHLHAERFEIGGSVTEPLQLEGSTRGERLGEPPEDHPRASKVGQRDDVAALVREGEVRRVRPLGQHGARVYDARSGRIFRYVL